METTPEVIQDTPLGQEMELTALLPHEMVVAQQQLITWCDGKLLIERRESKELFEATKEALKNGWKHATLKHQYKNSVKRISYYEKIKAALLQGYYIIPNFDVEVFLIRTKKEKPLSRRSARWNDIERTEQTAHDVPLGEGEYKNNRPIIVQTELDEKNTIYWADRWDDIQFPVNMAKPVIMEATANAMKHKIFDQFGVFPSTRKKVDPVIIGQIRMKSGPFSSKVVSFMIAWHLNTNVL